MKSIKNDVVVITGTGNGIVHSLAILLANLGAKLALNRRTIENPEETASLLNLDKANLFTQAY
ncbi:MAG: hypothetical protein RIA69_07020 [Cyclobacteriaceae bacterium]